MKGILLVSLLFVTSAAIAQDHSPDSLQAELHKVQTDEKRVDILNQLSYIYSQLSLDRAEQYARQALDLATKVKYAGGQGASYNNLGICLSIKGQYTSGLDYFIKALRIRETEKDSAGVSRTLNNMARIFTYQKDYDKAISYSKKSLEMLSKTHDPTAVGFAHIALGAIYTEKKDYEGAMTVLQAARDIFTSSGKKTAEGWVLIKMADVLNLQKKPEQALGMCFQALTLIDKKKDIFSTIELYQSIGRIYSSKRNNEEALRYIRMALVLADSGNDSNGKMSTRLQLSNIFREMKQYDSALFYQQAYIALNAEIFNAEKSKQLATLEKIYETEKKDQQLELNEQKIRSQSLIITAFSILFVAIAALGFIVFRYYQQKKQSNIALGKLNREIYEKHEEILTQAEELTQANEEIRRINDALEKEIGLRTEKIERQNEKLIDYAYSNAHNVRGPLARILGLSLLMIDEEAVDSIKEYNRYLYTSAQELDNVIREINNKLEDEV